MRGSLSSAVLKDTGDPTEAGCQTAIIGGHDARGCHTNKLIISRIGFSDQISFNPRALATTASTTGWPSTILRLRPKPSSQPHTAQPMWLAASTIISLYSRSLTTREIEGHLLEIYGVEVSPGLVSQVNEAVYADVQIWQTRPWIRAEAQGPSRTTLLKSFVYLDWPETHPQEHRIQKIRGC